LIEQRTDGLRDDVMSVDYQIGIIGAGFGGIIAALELKRSNRPSFIVLERADEVGGIWRDNTYPGCACDIRSHLYRIESKPNPGWTFNYASQPEILQYLRDVVRKDHLGRHIRFGWDVREIEFLESERCWKVAGRDGQAIRVGVIILAIGPQSRPYIPALRGHEKFAGTWFHSSAWDRSVVLSGKRVAIIGTGASAIQIVPSIAADVSRLFVFQRTPAWIIPRGARRLSSVEHWMFKHVPATQSLLWHVLYWTMEVVALGVLGNRTMSALLTAMARRNLRKAVRDPAIREKLTPRYQIGCKRILVSDDFYPAISRANVKLVTDEIGEITARGIQTRDGAHYDVDHIIFATGFSVADPDQLLRIVGRGGRVLAEEWGRRGMEAYLGVNVAGYPNLSILLGPNSGPANSTAIHVIESQMRYILKYIEQYETAGQNACLDVDPAVQKRYNETLRTRLTSTAWNSGCHSWYIDRHGNNTTMYPGLTSHYRKITSRFAASDYRIIG
jgi:cation diffusion facilitator CzcD-associated flavoprotein CzcO